MNTLKDATLDSLCGVPPDDESVPYLDRNLVLDTVNHATSEFGKICQSWRRDGVAVLKKAVPDDLIEAYCEVRAPLGPAGWPAGTPYMHCPELRDLALHPNVMKIVEGLIGEKMALHLNLTGWVSTTRNWHPDSYLNPEYVNSWYAATWIALEDIHPDSGPFQYVPGSHRWPPVLRGKLFAHLTPEQQNDPDWPWHSQDVISSLYDKEIALRQAPVVDYLPEKGDVLIWHAHLIHRGSLPRVPGTSRKSLISHYSAVSKRLDMPVTAVHRSGYSYFVL